MRQRGGTILGLILGLVLGLGAALAVAVYVTKVPVPFLSKAGLRSAEQDAAEAEKNRDWNPNQGLQSKNAPPPASAPAVKPEASTPAGPETTPTAPPQAAGPAPTAAPESKTAAGDPLGDLAKAKNKTDLKADAKTDAKADTTAPTGQYEYYVQAGAFNAQADADAQRAKLAMLGWQARVSENKKEGRTVFRVRVGPFAKRDDAAGLKDKLDEAGVSSNLVRVQL